MRIARITADEALPVRHAVLWPERAPEFSRVADDELGLHFGAFEEERLVGVASLFVAGAEARLRKFATLLEWQGRGIGSALLLRCLDEARGAGCHHFWCDARLDAIAFYHRFGLREETAPAWRDGKQFVRMGCVFSAE